MHWRGVGDRVQLPAHVASLRFVALHRYGRHAIFVTRDRVPSIPYCWHPLYQEVQLLGKLGIAVGQQHGGELCRPDDLTYGTTGPTYAQSEFILWLHDSSRELVQLSRSVQTIHVILCCTD